MAGRPRDALRAKYGFSFPDTFFEFNAWVDENARLGLDLHDVLEMSLAEPFRVFEPGIDLADFDPISTARYFDDPPELFTILHGNIDGLHWGYWLDAGEADEYPVVCYYHGDAFELAVDGNTVFEAVASFLERAIADTEEYRDTESEEERPHYDQQLEQLIRLAERLEPHLPEQDLAARAARAPVAATRDGMGIVVDPALYRPLPGPDPFELGNLQLAPADVARMASEAMEGLQEAYPGAALKLGKDLWTFREYTEVSVTLLDAAYGALDRPLQRSMLRYRRS